jgi:hypothetical protein
MSTTHTTQSASPAIHPSVLGVIAMGGGEYLAVLEWAGVRVEALGQTPESARTRAMMQLVNALG